MSKFTIQDDSNNRIIVLDTNHAYNGMPLALPNVSIQLFSNQNSLNNGNAEIIVHYELAHKIFQVLASLVEPGNKNG